MSYTWTGGEPISLTLARLHLRITPDEDSPPFHPDDDWLTEIGIPAAREYCEGFLGYTLASSYFGNSPDEPLPASIKAAMLLMLGHLYENREATNMVSGTGVQELPIGVQALLIPYQLRTSMA
jgi:hypothetical protein